MTYYVCQSISNVTKTCTSWVLHTDPTLLPELTLAQGNAIGFACLLVFAVVFVIKMCIRSIS